MDNRSIIKRIGSVMKVEATVPSRGDFLLTHVPFRNLSLGASEPITEERLFEEKLLANPEEHKTIMILGENGSGKSHLIRWLYEKYIKVYGEDNDVEKILWISKAHNTLQDALMQLLKSNVFPEEIRKNELEKVKNAQSAISGVELRKTINFNFTLEIEDENEKKIKSPLIDPVSRNMLPSYLKNEYILNNYLMRKNGPLDRICSKLNNVDNSSSGDFEGEVFVEGDFAITMADLKKHLESGEVIADSYTISLAKKLMMNPGGKLRKNIADYMNSKVDDVIQRSLKLTTSDFKQLFWSLRTKLKERGMRLTLFVEDINAFTGIDLALMDVLVANHESEGNEDYCRLASVVGTTNDFYKNRLNDSLRDRVKDVGAEVYIREESLFGDAERLTEFAAKYINACKLEKAEIELWEKDTDCDEVDLPVVPDRYDFSRVVCAGKEMSIFPFNRNAILNLYEKLDSLSKTPRRFLIDVLYPVLTMYYSSPDTFLDNEAAFKNDSITSLNDFLKPQYTITNASVGGPDAERRSLLLRIWGDATTEVRGETLGGLNKEIFDAFGIDMMLDKFKEYAGTRAEDLPKGDATTSPNVSMNPLIDKTKQESNREKNNTDKDITYSKIRSQIGEWAKNPDKKLIPAQELRTLLSRFIYANISWDVEEIPHSVVVAYYDSIKYISIEGQTASSRDDGLIVKRIPESEFLFYALIGYKYLGNNSWNFDQGLEYYTIATTWLTKHHDEILRLVHAPYEKQASYSEVLLASMYCERVFNGGVQMTDSVDSLMFRLFNTTSSRSTVHSEKWNSISEEISQIEEYEKYRDRVINVFSNGIGAADVDETKYTFVDAHRIISLLNKIIECEWDLTKYAIKSPDMKKQDFWYRAPKVVSLFVQNMNQVVNAEMKMVNTYITYYRKKIPGYSDVKRVEKTFSRISDYLRYLTDKRNLSYDAQKVQMLRDLSSAQYVTREMGALDDIANKTTIFEKLNAMALNPFEHIKDIYEELSYFDQLMMEKNEKFRAGMDTTVSDQIEQYRKSIQSSLNKMISIGQGVNS